MLNEETTIEEDNSLKKIEEENSFKKILADFDDADSTNLSACLDATLALQKYALSGGILKPENKEKIKTRIEMFYTELTHWTIDYQTNYKFSAFLLARRAMLKAEDMQRSPTNIEALSAKLHTLLTRETVFGNAAVEPFIRNIAKHLLAHGNFTTTYTQEPFLWRIYVGEYIIAKAKIKEASSKDQTEKQPYLTSEKMQFSEAKIPELNRWLSDKIFNKPGRIEIEELLKLPLALREQLFCYSGSIIDAETLTIVKQPLFGSGFYARKATVEETDEIVTLSNITEPAKEVKVSTVNQVVFRAN